VRKDFAKDFHGLFIRLLDLSADSPKIAVHLCRKYSKIISLLSLVATKKFLLIFGLILYNFCL
jgi:hypothetical protein